MLSHSSIQLLLYCVNTNFATLIISLPLLRAYSRSFMGRNQFKKVRSRPLKSRRGKKTYAKDCGVCSSFVPKKLEQDFSVFMGFFERFANFVPTPFFKLEQGFSRVHRLLGAFVPIVPVFNKSSIYKYIYRDPFLYSFFRALGLKIIGTNGTFTGNAHHYGKKYVPTPILRIGTTGTNGTFSGKNPHK